MARNVRTYVGDSVGSASDGAPKHLTKQEFARRLYRMMADKGWTQSELARRADVTRDAVSTYVRGASMPNPLNAQKLADALGVPLSQIMPNQIEQAIDHDPPAIDLKVSVSNPKVAWLRINRLVSTSVAMAVLELINKDEPEVE